MMGIFIGTLTAFILSICLVYLDNALKSSISLEKEYEKLLPGYNCGACGYGSCNGLALNMVNNPLEYHKCRFLKDKLLQEMEMYLIKTNKLNNK